MTHSVWINIHEICWHEHTNLACWIINLLLDVLMCSIAEKFLLVVCILTRTTGSPKYGTTRKNTQRCYTTKRLIRCMYLRSIEVWNMAAFYQVYKINKTDGIKPVFTTNVLSGLRWASWQTIGILRYSWTTTVQEELQDLAIAKIFCLDVVMSFRAN